MAIRVTMKQLEEQQLGWGGPVGQAGYDIVSGAIFSVICPPLYSCSALFYSEMYPIGH